MRRIFRKRRKIKNVNFFVEPDEIFLDSENIEQFDTQQFEGRIEKPIAKRNIIILGLGFVLIFLAFTVRAGYLQISKGEEYFQRSEDNNLEKQLIFADRGIIYDRNKVELAWNNKSDIEGSFPIRKYLTPGFSHLLGYISYPMQDKSGNYWQEEIIGKDGLEKQYAERLKGTNGTKIVETDARKKVHSENMINIPERGEDLVTTIDSRVQKELYSLIKNISDANAFKGGAGMIMNIQNGEVLTSTSYPEYDSEILSQGKDKATISNYFTDKRKVFIDKNISGLYTPGSIVKPFVALGALNEKVITPYKQILSTGSISIPNPYFPDKPTVFKDWKAHGWVDMRRALAVSSDVYFYEIGGGFQGQDGIGIANIEKYSRLFGIGEKTGIDIPDEINGVIPSPEWKAKNFNGDIWRVGDTYHTAIGQYGFQVTPIQMLRAVSAIANNGKLVTPHLLLGDTEKEQQVKTVELSNEYFTVVREGMRGAVTSGTSTALNIPKADIAAKSGTAQLGLAKDRVNSWIIGFFPYNNPKYAFVVLMESGPSTGTVSASYVMSQLVWWMTTNTPEYFE